VAEPIFHVVLHEPVIPNNTGNIGRTCVATGCALHLIRPLGFDTSVKACRRAGLDYWPRLSPIEHDSWEDFLGWNDAETAADARSWGGSATGATPARIWLFSTKADRLLWDADFRPGDRFVFGKETAGLPASMLADERDSVLRLPMVAGERSLNVATAVCAAIYEGLRQLRDEHALDLRVQQ